MVRQEIVIAGAVILLLLVVIAFSVESPVTKAQIFRHDDDGTTFEVNTSNVPHIIGNMTVYVATNVDARHDRIRILRPSYYIVDYQVSFSSAAAGDYEFELYENGVEINRSHSEVTTETADNRVNVASHIFIYLEPDDVITLQVQDLQSPPQDITLYVATITLHEI